MGELPDNRGLPDEVSDEEVLEALELVEDVTPKVQRAIETIQAVEAGRTDIHNKLAGAHTELSWAEIALQGEAKLRGVRDDDE